jgi:hypothetical protein
LDNLKGNILKQDATKACKNATGYRDVSFLHE